MRHHLWLGLGLLLGLLLLGLALNDHLTLEVQETRTHLCRASEAALRGETHQSAQHLHQAQSAWARAEGFLAYFVAQQKLDTITRELELLLLTDPEEERMAYLRSCQELVLELKWLVAGEGLAGVL